MYISMLKSKIHRATVTDANLNYVGSITIDSLLMRDAGIIENEKVQIVNLNNGNRFETYALAGVPGSGCICLNGASARCVHVDDIVIIMAYCIVTQEEAATLCPKQIYVNEKNKFLKFL